MKTKRLIPRRRVIVTAAICCLLLASACFAASKIVSYESHSPSSPQCTDYNDLSSLTDELGYDPVIPMDFDNGYVFENATLGTSEGKDADGNTVSSGKILNVTYSNPEKDDITLSVDLLTDETDTGTYDKTRDVNGVTIGGSAFTMKFVPPDYEKTKDDISRESKGNFQISYGSDSIEESSYVSAAFAKDHIQYMLLADGDNQPSLDELMDMAAEIVK